MGVLKSREEIEYIKRAQKITDDTFEYILTKIKPGVTEIEIASEIESFMKKSGAEALAFDPIVVSGVRGALPHGEPTDKKIENGELLTIDMGAVVNGYHSDMTRTVAIGEISSDKKVVYDIVFSAQFRATIKLKSGVKASDVDFAARDAIEKAGFAKFFTHSTGHGVGLKVHEDPKISSESDDILQCGMVVTIEPGIYIPNRLGVRLEDMLLITENGYEKLTHSPKRLIVL